jgi:predicted transcriptional regulator
LGKSVVRARAGKRGKKSMIVVTKMMKMLSNKYRLFLLYTLHERPKTWTELMFELQTNPTTLKYHLRYLIQKKLVTGKKSHGFKLTEAGKAFMELGIEDIITTVERATRIVDASAQPK